jgi:imidazolonepropionase-like amidohydrolase
VNAEFLALDLPERRAGPLALTHVTVVPMDAERRLPDHTVVIENGLIRSLGPNPDTSGMQVIDGTGLYVMPGLADMYTHYWDPVDAPLYLASGITTVRTVGTPFQLAMQRVAERAEFPSPRMVTISPPIDGVGPNGRTDMPRGVAMTRPEQADALVQRFARGGYRQIKAFSLLTPENLRALARAATAAGVRITANCPNAMTFEEAAEAGASCFDQLHNIARGHMRADAPQPGFWERFDPVPGTRLDFAAIRRLARFMAERQTWNVPTLVFHQRDGLAPAEGMTDPALKYVAPSSIKDWESTLIRWARRARLEVDEWRAAARERARAFLQVVAIFHEEGVPLLTGTDSLNPWNVQGASLHQELTNFVAAGMSPFAALRCATSEAARFLGESDRSGCVAVGKRADLVIMRSDPLKDVAALRAIEAVCVNGYYLTRTDLDRLLGQRAALAAAPPKLPALHSLENTWSERIVGAESGRVAWRHTRLADGGWLIEECHAAAVPRRHVERRNTRLALDRDFKLESCAWSVDTFAGTEEGEVTRSAAGEYAIKVKDIDGWESNGILAVEPMLPSERLTLSLWPLLFSHNGVVAVLDVEGGSLAVRKMTLAVKDDAHWQLRVDRPTHATEQIYRLTREGRFLGMQEMMPLLWLRELAPLP